MSKRYYICNVIGDGSIDNPYRAAVADVDGINWAASMPTGADGKPISLHVLAICATSDHAALRAMKNLDYMPVYPLDGKASGIARGTRDEMISMLGNRGLSTTFFTPSESYRRVIDNVGKQIDPAFNVDRFDVSDV